MIVLDTHALVFDALAPRRLGHRARQLIAEGERGRDLHCADISLWEIAMLVHKKRLDPGIETREFLDLALAHRGIQILPITPEIAAESQSPTLAGHGDPADRLIAATCRVHRAILLTKDRELRSLPGLETVW